MCVLKEHKLFVLVVCVSVDSFMICFRTIKQKRGCGVNYNAANVAGLRHNLISGTLNDS